MFASIGTISGLFGVNGVLRVTPESNHPERLKALPGMQIFVERNGSRTPYQVVSVQPASSGWLLRLEGIEGRDQAEKLLQGQIVIPKNQLLPLPPGEFYLFEIIGLRAETEAGELLGTISQILQPGANDVYVVQSDSGEELLIPAIKQVVLAIEPALGRVVVRLLPGLREGEEE